MMKIYVYVFAVSSQCLRRRREKMCQIIDSLFIRILGQELGCQNDGVKKVSTRREDSVEMGDSRMCRTQILTRFLQFYNFKYVKFDHNPRCGTREALECHI